VPADTAAGLGFLAAGLACVVAEVLVIRNRHRLDQAWLNQIDQWAEQAARAPRGTRWMWGSWSDPRLQDVEYRARLRGPWIGLAVFLPIVAVALIIGAVARLFT
jgi:hypothetical protein